MSQGTIQIDLLQEEKNQRFRIDPLFIVLLCLVLAVNTAFAFYGQHLVAGIEGRQAQVRQVQDEKRQIEASLPVIEERRGRIAKLDEQIKLIRGLVLDPIRYANLLTEVGRVLPPNVWLQSLTIEPASTSVQLSGQAVQVPGRLPLATVAQTLEAFNSSPYFADASLASTSETKDGFSFQLTVHYDPEAAVR